MRRCKGLWKCASFIFLMMLEAGCDTYKEKAEALPDTPLRGEIHISADESFKPIIDEHVKVYESNNRGTKINVHYKPEAECFKDLLVDSIRLIITTRGLSKQESRFVSDSLKVEPESLNVARDAIAVIVHPQSPDSLFTMDEIRAVLTGTFKKKFNPGI
ncbi:MAG: substrate-binding domain-containing protein [Chitinophagaceae bacterium]|nr:substrate-binding domain-containing protein [Chitinophagaceae bacterium]